MKLILKITACILLSWMLIFYSCMKEYSYEGGKNNKSPLAVAGPDAVITLPTDSVLLMATISAIHNGKISAAFGKNSGPASFRQYVVTLLTNKNFLNLKILKHVEIKHS